MKKQVTLAKVIRRVIKSARMENAHFGDIHGRKLTFDGVEHDADEFVKERIRLYMSTWVCGPLQDVEEVLNGERTVDSIKFWIQS